MLFILEYWFDMCNLQHLFSIYRPRSNVPKSEYNVRDNLYIFYAQKFSHEQRGNQIVSK